MQTQITPKIRVSTAGIRYPGLAYNPNPYFQYETWCFSDDPQQRSIQVIHGCSESVDFHYLVKSIKVHRYISRNLMIRFKKD